MKVRANLDGFVGFRGQSVLLTAGDEYDDADPLVVTHRHLFDPQPKAPRVEPVEPAKVTVKRSAPIRRQ